MKLNKIALALMVLFFASGAFAVSCVISATDPSTPGNTYTPIFSVSGVTGAHVAINPNEPGYTYKVWCPTPYTGNSCTTGTTLVRLHDITNSHVESPDQTTPNYDERICIESTGNTVTCGLSIGACPAGNFDEIIGISGVTNASVEDPLQGNYNLSICCSRQSITAAVSCSLSGNTNITVGGFSDLSSECRNLSGAPTACPGAPSWASSNTAIAIVNANGRVTGVTASPPNSTITANYGSFSCNTSVTVSATAGLAAQCTVSGASPIFETETVQYTASCSDASSITVPCPVGVNWNSDNTAIATVVSSTGMVTGQRQGTTGINANFTGFNCSGQITIEQVTPANNCTIDFADNIIAEGDSTTATVTCTTGVGGRQTLCPADIVWGNAPAGIISLSGTGTTRTVTGLSDGVASITVSNSNIFCENNISVTPSSADTCDSSLGATCRASCGAGEVQDPIDGVCNDGSGGALCCIPSTSSNFDDHVNVIVQSRDSSNAPKTEFNKRSSDPIHLFVEIQRVNPFMTRAFVTVTIAKLNGDDQIIVLPETMVSFAPGENVKTLESLSGAFMPVDPTQLDTEAYRITGRVVSGLDRDGDPDNNEDDLRGNTDTQGINIRLESEEGGFIAAPEIHPILIVFILASIIFIISKK